ncbi:MAG: MBL fold metallo-hydrolase [Aeromonas sp.]
MLQFEIIPVTAFAQNCSLIWCDATLQAALVDPGGEADKLLAAVAARGLTLSRVILTHGHLDHVGSAAELRQKTGARVIGAHSADKFWFDMLPTQCQMFGFSAIEAFLPDEWLNEGEQVQVGNERLAVLHCPGHTPGHIALYHAAQQLAWVGDILFAGSIGRTDFPQGDHATLIASITDKLLPLGDNVVFIPGHGQSSTFGREKVSNPYLCQPVW